jgi:hypothetical protein
MDKAMNIYEVIHIIHNASLPFPPRTPYPLIATTTIIAYFPLNIVLTMGSTSTHACGSGHGGKSAGALDVNLCYISWRMWSQIATTYQN